MAGKVTTLGQLVADLESALPALRELAEVNERLAAAKTALVAATTEAEAAGRTCEQTVARCAGKIKSAEEQRDKLVAEAEAEAIRRSNEAREKHERWQMTAKATRIREEEEFAARAAELAALNAQIESKRKEWTDIEVRLAAAKQAFKSALAEVG